jgi:hypothetical protein
VTISNLAGATANLVLSAFNFSRPEFTRTGGTCVTGGGGLAANSSCTVIVTYTPSAATTQNGSMTILHNGPTSPGLRDPERQRHAVADQPDRGQRRVRQRPARQQQALDAERRQHRHGDPQLQRAAAELAARS